MARPKTPTTSEQTANALVVMDNEALAADNHALTVQGEEVRALVAQLGYEGETSIGALEDGIRFYQRRTVEACLELGKRLAILKEMTPYGEFTERVEALGIARSSAYKFMQAAIKTSSRPNLGRLSTEIKSASAFLELVTQEDDVIESIAEMDDLDKQSASQLRAFARKMQQDREGANKLLEKRAAKIEALELELAAPFVPRPGSAAQTAAEQVQHDALVAAHVGTLAALRQMAIVVRDIKGHETGATAAMDMAADHAVQHTTQVLAELIDEHGLNVDLTEMLTPAWLQASAG